MQINEIAAEVVPAVAPNVETPTPEPKIAPKDDESTAKETPRNDGSVPLPRFNKVYAKAKETERENAQLKEELAKLKQPKPEEAPDISKYTDQAEYLKDLATWTGKQAARAEFQTLQESQKASQQQSQFATRQASAAENYLTQIQEANKKYPGIGERLQASPIIAEFSPETALMVAESKVAGELTHFLLENPEEAEELASMTPEAAKFVIRRIEKELSAAGNKVPAQKVSKMPPPPTPVRSGKHQPGARSEDETIEQMTARLFPLG